MACIPTQVGREEEVGDPALARGGQVSFPLGEAGIMPSLIYTSMTKKTLTSPEPSRSVPFSHALQGVLGCPFCPLGESFLPPSTCTLGAHSIYPASFLPPTQAFMCVRPGFTHFSIPTHTPQTVTWHHGHFCVPTFPGLFSLQVSGGWEEDSAVKAGKLGIMFHCNNYTTHAEHLPQSDPLIIFMHLAWTLGTGFQDYTHSLFLQAGGMSQRGIKKSPKPLDYSG